MSPSLQNPSNPQRPKSPGSKNSALRSAVPLIRPKKPYTGFIAHYDNGKTIRERENYFSKFQKKQCATNWSEVDKVRLVALELVWNDQSMITIKKEDCPSMTATDWYFSHSGYLDMLTKKIRVIKRNIGYVKNGLLHIYSVSENNGALRSSTRGV